MKIASPKPPFFPTGELEIQTNPHLEPETDVSALRLSGVGTGDARHARFSQVGWDNARLGAVNFGQAQLEDSRFWACDLANLDARRVFVSRLEIRECRATGFCAPESDWRDVRFVQSNFSLSLFRQAKFERARFEECDLREADFQNADLRSVVFDGCDLRGAQFSFAKMQGADISTCQSEELGIEAGALRGLIVSPVQAARFAAILGLKVRWQGAAASSHG